MKVLQVELSLKEKVAEERTYSFSTYNSLPLFMVLLSMVSVNYGLNILNENFQKWAIHTF